MTSSSPTKNIRGARAPADAPCSHSKTGLTDGHGLCFFDDSLDSLQQEAVSRALGTVDPFLIEVVDERRRHAVLAELLRQMAFRGADVLVLRAAAPTAEFNGYSQSLNNAREQWTNLLKLAEQATSISHEGAIGGYVACSGQGSHAPRLSWWLRATHWLRNRRRWWHCTEESAARLQDTEESWAALGERLTGFPLSPPPLQALNEWHRHMCSTETANGISATCHEVTDDRFDMVILLSAECLADDVFPDLAAKGRKVIAFGALPPVKSSDISTPCPDAELGAFGRLWRSLQGPPFGARYRWVEQAGHIACRLDDCPYDSTYVERERVADRPEIELRIEAPPHGSPRLVEIVFPRGLGIEECKEFAYRELEDLALDATGKTLRWHDAPSHVMVQLSLASSGQDRFVEIAPGVRERVNFANCEQPDAGRWITERLEFDRNQGWNLEKAASWLKAKSGFWNDERTLSLESAPE
jgi:hypothetical protein